MEKKLERSCNPLEWSKEDMAVYSRTLDDLKNVVCDDHAEELVQFAVNTLDKLLIELGEDGISLLLRTLHYKIQNFINDANHLGLFEFALSNPLENDLTNCELNREQMETVEFKDYLSSMPIEQKQWLLAKIANFANCHYTGHHDQSLMKAILKTIGFQRVRNILDVFSAFNDRMTTFIGRYAPVLKATYRDYHEKFEREMELVEKLSGEINQRVRDLVGEDPLF